MRTETVTVKQLKKTERREQRVNEPAFDASLQLTNHIVKDLPFLSGQFKYSSQCTTDLKFALRCANIKIVQFLCI